MNPKLASHKLCFLFEIFSVCLGVMLSSNLTDSLSSCGFDRLPEKLTSEFHAMSQKAFLITPTLLASD